MPVDLFRDAGGVRAAYEAVDWASTPLGPVEEWSPTLLGTVSVMLNTRFPVTLLWGPELVLVYNAAYVDLIADKHPAALGRAAREVFPEAWEVIGPVLARVMNGGGASYEEDAPIPMMRSGFLEECYWTYSYSPVPGPDGSIEGLIDLSVETTRQVVTNRRMRLSTRLHQALAPVMRPDDVVDAALSVLATDPADLPEVSLVIPAPDGAWDLELVDGSDGRTARLPLGRSGGRAINGADGMLEVRLGPQLRHDGDYLDFLRLVGSAIGDALGRSAALEEERSMSMALQLSLLSRPPAADGFEIAVRYQPAAEQAQVGGDWYDAFWLPDGAMALVVGDVAGHDQAAAATMAQLRSLARGVAVTLHASPAAVMSGLDQAMAGLQVEAIATAVLAQVSTDDAGGLALRWSNAGHPPPAILDADGSVRLLETPPDLLLGLVAASSRAEFGETLTPGSTLLIYTDGLVERRNASMDESLAWLRGALAGQQNRTADELCSYLLDLLDGHCEDDVVLLAVRAGS